MTTETKTPTASEKQYARNVKKFGTPRFKDGDTVKCSIYPGQKLTISGAPFCNGLTWMYYFAENEAGVGQEYLQRVKGEKEFALFIEYVQQDLKSAESEHAKNTEKFLSNIYQNTPHYSEYLFKGTVKIEFLKCFLRCENLQDALRWAKGYIELYQNDCLNLRHIQHSTNSMSNLCEAWTAQAKRELFHNGMFNRLVADYEI